MAEINYIISDAETVAEFLKDNIGRGDIYFATRYVIAYDGNNIVGCVGVHTLTHYTAEIKHLYVLPEYRKRGIAREMLMIIQLDVNSNNFPLMTATVRFTSNISKHLFDKFGWEVVGVKKSPYSEHNLFILLKHNRGDIKYGI